MKQKVFKTGNSLAVTIPSKFAESVGVRPGDSVEASQDSRKGRITYQFENVQQLPLDELLLKKINRRKRAKNKK